MGRKKNLIFSRKPDAFGVVSKENFRLNWKLLENVKLLLWIPNDNAHPSTARYYLVKLSPHLNVKSWSCVNIDSSTIVQGMKVKEGSMQKYNFLLFVGGTGTHCYVQHVCSRSIEVVIMRPEVSKCLIQIASNCFWFVCFLKHQCMQVEIHFVCKLKDILFTT